LKVRTMELAHSTIQQNYIKQIKALEAKIEKATENELDVDLLDENQKKLDELAEKYQYNEKVGSSLYKLYELQATIHYFNGKDAEALDFINQAIETRGSSYPRAEKLKAQLLKSGEYSAGKASDMPPLQLQALTKDQRSSAIIMAIISVLTVYFIPWAIFYIVLATKLDSKKVPNRGLVKAAAIATLPLCFALIPIIIDVEFWKFNKKLKEYQEKGSKAFMPDKQWLEEEPKRKRQQRIGWAIVISLIAIFAFLILFAILSR
jgi:hypothetical protein